MILYHFSGSAGLKAVVSVGLRSEGYGGVVRKTTWRIM